MLVQKLIEEQIGRTFHLKVLNNAPWALNLYLKHGFSVVSEDIITKAGIIYKSNRSYSTSLYLST